ncbi:MAG: hypothetical protein LBR83_03305 [Clostridiales bacterium]|nr:hypothetical protein [Clostridiales bacterium]
MEETNQAPTTANEPVQETQSQTSPAPPTNDFMNDPNIVAYIELKIQEGIQKALQGQAPKASTVNPSEQERKKFEKMTYRERLKLFQSDPHTYNKLTKGAV